MCSGVDDPEKIRDATSLGAHAYLLKPVQHLYLSAAVERCLTERPAKRTPEHLGSPTLRPSIARPGVAISATSNPDSNHAFKEML